MTTLLKNTWVVLIRGINVGGNNIVPMKELRERLANVGYKNVRTYIQSGNVVLDTEETNKAQICDTVAGCIDDGFGFSPNIMVLNAKDLLKIIRDNPYPDAVEAPKLLHISFLSEPAVNVDINALNNLKTDTERFHITKYAVYAYFPEGIGKSKLAAKMEKYLGIAATARNWRSANKILELAQR